jgi:hypothetical protein
LRRATARRQVGQIGDAGPSSRPLIAHPGRTAARIGQPGRHPYPCPCPFRFL